MTDRNYLTVPGALNRFVAKFPKAKFVIRTDFEGHTVRVYINGMSEYGEAIARYSRLRDCKRALRNLEYVPTGACWSPAPKAAMHDGAEVSLPDADTPTVPLALSGSLLK